jgi:hypothetical protein
MIVMRELRQTKIEGQIFLYPYPVEKNNKYLILCLTMDESKRVIDDVKNNKLTHPDISSEDFIFIQYHSDQHTKIYSCSSKPKP